jgi:hypothetical protein
MTTLDRRSVLRTTAAAAVLGGLGAALAPPSAASAAAAGPAQRHADPPIPDVPGMAGDPRANEFWYQYDARFLYDPGPEVAAAFQQIMEVLGPVEGGFYGAWATSRAEGTYPEGYVSVIAPAREPMAVISRLQLALIDEFYGRDHLRLIRAFMDFGQGVLYDPRRPTFQKVHMMDYTNNVDPPGGYHVWHAINRGLMLLDVDRRAWQRLDPLVGLTWAIQSIAKPLMDVPNNPRLDWRLLLRLSVEWLPRTPSQLDIAFDSIPYPEGIR